ncbi:MAG: ATP-binding protein [Myxococcales bacterium]|nr:ATP-binding protein [Myxococcales bacterium]
MSTHSTPAPTQLLVLAGHSPGHSSRQPYVLQAELVYEQLAAVRRRLRAAVDHMQATTVDDAPVLRWPPELIAAEAAIEARIQATSRAGTDLPMVRLRDRFGLTPTEERALWVLVAHELCPISRQMIRDLATEQAPDPTTGALRRAVYAQELGPHVWSELGDEGTLRRFALIDQLDATVGVSEHRQTWKVSRRVLALVHGDLRLDRALEELACLDTGPSCELAELELTDGAHALVEEAFDRSSMVLVHGRVGTGRRSLLTAIARERGLAVLTIDGKQLAKERDPAHRQLLRIARECQLLDLVPLITNLDALGASSEAQDRLDLVERELHGLVLATAARPIARRWKRAPIAVELAPLLGTQRARLWSRALPAAESGDAEILSTMYPLAPAFIHAAGRIAVERCGEERMTPEHIEAGLRAVLDDRLAGLATRITITQTWDDLVLPDDQTTAIAELLSRIRERQRVYEDWGFANKVGKGLGVSALFSGPPGTGKTMAAGLVARALRVELYQVDLSKVVSKWIGETEKNLAALFDAAEAGHAVLLFDEADALFGKRTDVKSSNDRHANQEVNFLLQRLETFAGICILTTNHETAIDEAFRRRLSVHVKFPMPEAEERARLWEAMLPADAPREGDLAIDALATKYVMSGGYIRNAVLRAAFLAADEEGVIDAGRLARAAQLEYEALGKIVSTNR